MILNNSTNLKIQTSVKLRRWGKYHFSRIPEKLADIFGNDTMTMVEVMV